MKPNKLSVILVNYKTYDLTREAVETLLTKSPWIREAGEIIIVDNDSQDGSYEKLRDAFPGHTVIHNSVNSGFSGGNNVGMKIAKGEYVLLLNTDTISIEEAVKPLLDWLDGHQDIGIATIQLLYEDRLIQSTGGYFPRLWQVFCWMSFLDDVPGINSMIKSFHPASASFNHAKTFFTKEQELDWITGAFFMVRKKVIDTVGLFDENMFMYAEEMEFCYRAKQAGFGVRFVPIAKIIHLQGKSSSSIRSPILGEYKNIVYFYKKHMPRYQLPILRLLLKIGALLRVVLIGIVKRRKEAIGVYLEAFRLA